MDFDHLGDKKFAVGSSISYTLDAVREEIAKCEVVCANCHRERTYGDRPSYTKGPPGRKI